jgi:HlyD family secretion protein
MVSALVALVAVALIVAWVQFGPHSNKTQDRLVLYGNVDLRQVELAFNNSERIAKVMVQEGDKVALGLVLAHWTRAG